MTETIYPEYDELEATSDSTNAPSEFIGDIMTESPDNGITRLYFQNLNGLCWNNEGGKWPYICEVMESIQVDIACFAETNTDTNNYNVRRKMESICQKQFNQSRLVLSSSKYHTKSTYKPGGTAILACNTITSSIKSHSRDRMGRWTTIRLVISPTKCIRIISAYQVGAEIRQGSGTAAAQQRAQIIEEQSTGDCPLRKTPREAFIQDLQSFICQAQKDGDDIILAGDFNEEITSSASGIDQLATTCGLADIFSIRLGSATVPATYQRGPRRIDFVLLTPTLLHYVQAAGYDPFGYRIPTDHRGLYIDFSTSALFSQALTPLASVDKRDFVSTTPETIRKYVTAKMTYLHDHRFFERIDDLNNLTQPNHALAEALDRDFQRASKHAARKCARRQQAPWSPILAEAWAELHFYRLARANLTLTINLAPAVTKLQNQWENLPRELPTDHIQIRDGYNQALTKLKHARQEAKRLREEYLERKAALYSALEERGKSKVVRRLLRAEAQRTVYNKIRYLRNSEHGTKGLSALKIPKGTAPTDFESMKDLPDTPDYWETVTVPEEIEQLLLQRNCKHFGQAEGTPFTRPPLQADVGYKADGYAAELILAGQIDYKSVSPATSLLIQHLQTHTNANLQGYISLEDVRGKLKHWTESTTTSPSGLHLGHYHCMWRDPQIAPEEGDREQVIDMQEKLLQCVVDLINYAIKFRYTYQRWTNVVNIMLQKDPGNPRIHRLRVIHIYEADYNLLLAVKWRQALHHAEDHKLLNEGLYGSRPGRSAHDPAFMEVLQHETYRMSMKTGINFDLDASSCYDRILANLASLCSRRIGVDKNVAFVNALTLEQAQYRLKTSLGITKDYYHHSQTQPIHGTGQGSGNSPTIWCFVCSTLFDAYQSRAHGAQFTDYDKSTSITVYMIGFVDDCTQRVNKFDADTQPTPQELISLMEKDAQLWNDLLWSSGGALEPLKCSFHLIQTSWNNDGHPFLAGGTQGLQVHLTHQDGTTPINHKSNYESHKTLGCFINPAHCHAHTWTVIQKKNQKLATLIESNYFTRAEAWTFYTAIYLPSITYPLPITPLTKTQCTQLDIRFLRSLIPRCGYNRNMATAIRYGPTNLGGAGFKQLYLEQGALMLQQVFKYLNSPETVIGKILRMTISWTQAFLGTSAMFLTEVDQPIPPVGPSILLDLRQFLREINGQLIIQPSFNPKPLRQFDRFIMDIALQQSRWNKRHLSQINSCRRYLQAQTLADMTNLSGTKLLKHVQTGEILPSSLNQRCARFNQIRPGDAAWRTWRRFLSTISDKQGTLINPLGPWKAEITQLRHWPMQVYDPQIDCLYTHLQGPQYRIHHRLSPGIFQATGDEITTDVRGYPNSVMTTAGILRPAKNHIHPLDDNGSLGDAQQVSILSNLPPWEHELLQYCTMLKPIREINQHLSSGNVVLCSDGSSTTRGGTFGFVAATKQGTRLVKCHGPAPGAYNSSFRSEAYGVLATIRWLHHTITQINFSEPTVIDHHLDNKSVIKRIESTRKYHHEFPNQRLKSEQDVIDEIKVTLDNLPIEVNFIWIKGHQDSGKPLTDLPLAAQLNCEADKEANKMQALLAHPHHTVTPLPSTPCQLVIQQKSITSKLKRRIHEIPNTNKLMEYLQEKFQWNITTVEAIDWDIFSNILQKYRDKWTTIVKHIHDISPTGQIAHRNNSHLPHECPACSHPQECNTHVIVCPHYSRAKWRSAVIQKIGQQQSTTTDPYLIDILRDGLIRFHQQSDKMSPNDYPPRYTQLILTQNAIGWNQLYKGRWSKEWRKIYDDYVHARTQLTDISKGQSWVLSTGRWLIDQWLELWKLRNEQRHGKDKEPQQQLRTQILRSELIELYSLKNQVCPSDRSIFYPSVNAHLTAHKSLDSIEDWIAINKEAIKASVTQAARLGVTNNRNLLDYPVFNPILRVSN